MKAPFVFTIHDDASEWYDCPIFDALKGLYVRLTTDSETLLGRIREVHADGNLIFELGVAGMGNNDLRVVGLGSLREVHYF